MYLQKAGKGLRKLLEGSSKLDHLYENILQCHDFKPTLGHWWFEGMKLQNIYVNGLVPFILIKNGETIEIQGTCSRQELPSRHTTLK